MLAVEVAEQLGRKIYSLKSNTIYMLTVRAMTSVGQGAAASVSKFTLPASR